MMLFEHVKESAEALKASRREAIAEAHAAGAPAYYSDAGGSSANCQMEREIVSPSAQTASRSSSTCIPPCVCRGPDNSLVDEPRVAAVDGMRQSARKPLEAAQSPNESLRWNQVTFTARLESVWPERPLPVFRNVPCIRHRSQQVDAIIDSTPRQEVPKVKLKEVRVAKRW